MGIIIFVQVLVETSAAVDRPQLDSGNGWSISDFAAGLHREGSKAVFRYTSLELADRFALLNAAFGEEGYKWERLENYGIILYLTFFYPRKNATFVEVSIVIGSAIGLPQLDSGNGRRQARLCAMGIVPPNLLVEE